MQYKASSSSNYMESMLKYSNYLKRWGGGGVCTWSVSVSVENYLISIFMKYESNKLCCPTLLHKV